MPTTLEEKQRVRLLVLNAAYDASDGDPYPVNTADIARGLGLPHDQVWSATHYLSGRGLVHILGGSGQDYTFYLEHSGVVEVEAARSRPTRGTEHFPAPVISWVVNNISNSSVGAIQAGAGNVASVVQRQGPEAEALATALRRLAETAPAERPELRETVDDLREEALKPDRKVSRLRAYLGAATALGKDVAGFVAVVQEVAKLLGLSA